MRKEWENKGREVSPQVVFRKISVINKSSCVIVSLCSSYCKNLFFFLLLFARVPKNSAPMRMKTPWRIFKLNEKPSTSSDLLFPVFQLITGHNAAITACAFSPDGKYLVSYSCGENRLSFWQVSTCSDNLIPSSYFAYQLPPKPSMLGASCYVRLSTSMRKFPSIARPHSHFKRVAISFSCVLPLIANQTERGTVMSISDGPKKI